MMDEMKQLIPQPEIATLSDGGTVEIWPLRVRQFAPFAAAVAPLLGLYEGYRQREYTPDDWLSLIQARTDDVVAALAIALGLPPERIGEWFIDDLLAVALKVVAVNTDFFNRAAMPKALEAAAGLAAIFGATPSSGSSDPGTATPPATP